MCQGESGAAKFRARKGKGGDGLELLRFVNLGTPMLVLGMLLYLDRINSKVNSIREDMQEIKDGMIWNDRYMSDHQAIIERVYKLEKKTGLNGSSK